MNPRPLTRYLCCIPVEGAVTALGYFQASISVLGILVTLRSIVILLNHYVYLSTRQIYYSSYDLIDIKEKSFWLLELGLCLTLAILLIVGVKKRRPGYVLSYLIVGVMMAVAGAVYWLVYVSADYYFRNYCAVDLFLVLFVYSLCLPMVYFVYRNIKLENHPNSTLYQTLQHDCAEGTKKESVYCINLFEGQKPELLSQNLYLKT